MSPRTSIQNENIRRDRKASIEEAALAVFAEDGYHSASVSKIAKQANVSKGLMYNYFENKEALLKELIRDVFQDIIQKLNLPTDRPLVKKDIIQYIDRSFDLVQEDPIKWKLFMSVYLQQDVQNIMKEEAMSVATSFFEPFMKYFKDNGFEEDPMSATLLFHSTIDGVNLKYVYAPEVFEIPKIKASIIKLFLQK